MAESKKRLEVGMAFIFEERTYKILSIDGAQLNLLSLTEPREEIFALLSPQLPIRTSPLTSVIYKVLSYEDGSFLLESEEDQITYELPGRSMECLKNMSLGRSIFVVIHGCFGHHFVGNIYTY